MSVYDFTVKDDEGNDVSLSKYKGKVSLIVNSATECGFTPQYTELERMYSDYKDQDFIILDFPCNQFGGQAPGTNDEIVNFCRLKFAVEYPIFSKIDVNGENEDPLYTYLKEQKGYGGTKGLTDAFGSVMNKLKSGKKDDIRWNFTKFLVDREGNVVARFEPKDDLNKLEEQIKELL